MAQEQAAQIVYLLWHSAPNDPADDEYDTDDKLLGVFSSNDAAEWAKERALTQPGFRAWPDRFLIEPHAVDKLEWTEGFDRVHPDGTWGNF